MRCLVALVLMTSPVAAWEFAPRPVCTLTHQTPGLDVRLTYDPRKRQAYAIELTRPDPWPSAPAFGLRFSGGREATITTPHHMLSSDRLTLTVRDHGFGNVLNGLEFNRTATAFLGSTASQMSLLEAAKPIKDFRACLAQPSV